jgi:hypothetical protein
MIKTASDIDVLFHFFILFVGVTPFSPVTLSVMLLMVTMAVTV